MHFSTIYTRFSPASLNPRTHSSLDLHFIQFPTHSDQPATTTAEKAYFTLRDTEGEGRLQADGGELVSRAMA